MPIEPPFRLRIAVPAPLHRSFDYLPPEDVDPECLRPGIRLRVSFGRSTVVGLLLEVTRTSAVDPKRLKPALAILDDTPLLVTEDLKLLLWASGYYHHPVGEVISAALPVLLRRGQAAHRAGLHGWRLTDAGSRVDPQTLGRAPLQAALLQRLGQSPEGVPAPALADIGGDWRGALRALLRKGWVEQREVSDMEAPAVKGDTMPPPALNPDQARAVVAVRASLGGFQAFLLDGVTGSGKTEVYLQLIETAAQSGRQALVLVPEIGLTPQLVARFRRRLPYPIAVLHSGLSERERLGAWLMARDGTARIVIGTRSAVFTPLHAPGLFIVDEEHDLSLKQQEGFRYSARDIAVMRAQSLGVPIVLGSATPSLESLYNAREGRYRRLVLPARAGGAAPPAMRVLDIRRLHLEQGLSQPLIAMIGAHLARDEQVLLFLNRRGYAPVLICHDCGWLADCQRCDAHMTYHRRQGRLRCHHCGAERPMDTLCPACEGKALHPLGQGTERIESALAQHFPATGMARIDRDNTRRKGALETMLGAVRSGQAQLMVGTQMLAKGHHFPNVTLVAILDADAGLFSSDFRAAERMAQLIIQVAGRAGRADKPGTVLIQTHHPDHPLLALLIREGYEAFAEAALAERREARFPPYAYQALLRAEATDAQAPLRFLQAAREAVLALNPHSVEILGPVASPMERRAGRYRAQLLLQSAERRRLHKLLAAWIPGLGEQKLARKVRWSLDVDPQEMI